MKIQIVHLETHDDVVSTRDKMGWGQTSRIFLIWPRKGIILTRLLDLVLIQRHSLAIGAQLSLVTRDEVVCFHARQLGIPTYPTLRRAQSPLRGRGSSGLRQRLRRSRLVRQLTLRKPQSQAELLAIREQGRLQPAAWSAHPAIRLGAFIVGMLGFLALLVMLIPGASIELVPRQENQHMTLPLTASPDFDLPKLTGEVPAHWVSVVVEARDSIPATGKVSVPEKSAAGYVTFTNLTSQAVEIPKGTVVRTLGSEPVKYATTQTGRVAAGIGRFREIPVRALSPGVRGNVAASAVQSVEGNLGLKVSCTNAAPLRGGSDQLIRGPSNADREKLFARLTEALETTAQQELESANHSTLREGDFPILPSLKFMEVLEQKYQPEEGIPADRLELTLRLEFQALVVSAQDLLAVIEPVMAASLPEGYAALAGTLQVKPVRIPVMVGKETARWQAAASQTIQAMIPVDEVIQAARGLPADQVSAHLYAALPLAQLPTIRVFPRWWPYIPFVPIRIEVN